MATDGHSWHVNITKMSQQQQQETSTKDMDAETNLTLLQVLILIEIKSPINFCTHLCISVYLAKPT